VWPLVGAWHSLNMLAIMIHGKECETYYIFWKKYLENIKQLKWDATQLKKYSLL
jgi:hypothetical protein